MTTMGISFVLIGNSYNIFYIFFIILISGATLPLMDILIQSLIHERTSQNQWGKIYSMWRYIAEFGFSIGILLSGPLADVFNIRILLVVTGGYGAIVGLLLYFVVNKKNH